MRVYFVFYAEFAGALNRSIHGYEVHQDYPCYGGRCGTKFLLEMWRICLIGYKTGSRVFELFGVLVFYRYSVEVVGNIGSKVLGDCEPTDRQSAFACIYGKFRCAGKCGMYTICKI